MKHRMITMKLLALQVLLPVVTLLVQLQGCYCEEYDSLKVEDLWDFFGCTEIFEEARPIHPLSDWLGMRDAYQAAVGLKRSSLVVSTGNGFAVDYQVHQADEK